MRKMMKIGNLYSQVELGILLTLSVITIVAFGGASVIAALLLDFIGDND